MSGISLVSANLAALVVETFFYGIYFILSVISAVLIFSPSSATPYSSTYRRSPSATVKRPIFISAILLFIFVTAHWICDIFRAYQAFVLFEGGVRPSDFYADLSQSSKAVKNGLLVASKVTSDATLVYRLWLAWERNSKIIIFPTVTLLGLTIFGVGITYQVTQVFPGEQLYESSTNRWVTGDCVFTLCTNLYCTVLIVRHIWKTNDAFKTLGSTSVNNILITFIESAMIYTFWSALYFITYESHSNLQFVFLDTWAPIAGIAFMLINVRISLGWTRTYQKESIIHVRTRYSGDQRPLDSEDTLSFPPLVHTS
ncbi:hypothetical protein K435DRAFT_740107 [Dendrothele bispora CBS 962.96]|uniref:Uncharacterized protein n=1 Tax=Dendrothele bispora (strain CBS 962.96) TaxID=1314807 RepID=A0A4S8MYD3_DENBC|nr:hypothetical protein K435DRAFT_740107 [Dendrothele bispora CBS 962.96]